MTKRHSMAKRFSNYLDYIQSRNQRTRVLYLLSALSILLFISVAITLPFKDQVLNTLYPKSQQQAASTDLFITPGQMNLTATFNSI